MPDLSDVSKQLQQRLAAQASLLASLSGHPTLIGSGREQALTQLLREVIPRRFEALSGCFISQDGNTGTPQKTSSQVDLMVVDTSDYPTLFRAGDIAVALPHSIRAIVEVKSGLGAVRTRTGTLKSGETFLSAVQQVGNLNNELGSETPLCAVGLPTCLTPGMAGSGSQTTHNAMLVRRPACATPLSNFRRRCCRQ